MSVSPQQIGLLAVIGFVLVTPIRAAESNDPTRRQADLLRDAADGSFDKFTLLRAGFVASGVVDGEKLAEHQTSFDRLASILAERLPSEPTTREVATQVLGFLHDEVLVGDYYPTCTEVQHAFDRGDYNCVSATLLYQCLCRRLGLDPVAVATTTHVRSRFVDEQMDVETTCDDWFEAVSKDPSLQFLRLKLQETRELSDVQLVGKVFYNRGVSLLETKQFAAAIDLLDTALQLDPADQPASENRRAALNNWALAECDAGRFQRAAELVRQGLDEYPEYPLFLANDLHVHQRWAMALCVQQKFSRAVQVLDKAHARRPDVVLFDQGRFAIYRQWADHLLATGSYDEAWLLFEQSSEGHTGRSGVAAFQSESLAHAIDELLRDDRQDGAERLVRQGLRRIPDNAALLEQQRRLTKADL